MSCCGDQVTYRDRYPAFRPVEVSLNFADVCTTSRSAFSRAKETTRRPTEPNSSQPEDEPPSRERESGSWGQEGQPNPFCSICRHMSSCSVSGSPRICLSLIASIRPSIPAASSGLTCAPRVSSKVGFSSQPSLSIHCRRHSCEIGIRRPGLNGAIVAGASDGPITRLVRAPPVELSAACGGLPHFLQIARFTGAKNV
jgi:hypothetical protein